MKNLISFAVVLAIVSLTVRANAMIIVKFEEIAGGVVATTSGSLVVPGHVPDIGPIGPFVTNEYQSHLLSLYWISGSYNAWGGGTSSSSGITSLVLDASGDTFGYAGANFYFPSHLATGSTYTPDTTWTWTQNLTQLGLDHLTTTPIQVYQSFDGQTISFALIPEPSTYALLFAGAIAVFVALRRRKK